MKRMDRTNRFIRRHKNERVLRLMFLVFWFYLSQSFILILKANSSEKEDTVSVKEHTESSLKFAVSKFNHAVSDIRTTLISHSSNLNSIVSQLDLNKNTLKTEFKLLLAQTKEQGFDFLKSKKLHLSNQFQNALDKINSSYAENSEKVKYILFELKKIQNKMTLVLEEIDQIKSTKLFRKDGSSNFKSTIELIDRIITNLEVQLTNQIDTLVAQSDEVREFLELAIRMKWSQMLDTNKIADRFFLPNLPFENPIFMLKAKTEGTIKEVRVVNYNNINGESDKSKTGSETGSSSLVIYHLKVDFQICNSNVSSDNSCINEDVWIDYDQDQNLNLKLFSFPNLSNSVNPNQISVGDKIVIEQDGVTGTTQEPMIEKNSPEKTKEVSSRVSKQNSSGFADGNKITSRKTASDDRPMRSAAEGIITFSNGFAATCQEYIKTDGNFGVIGKAILNEINLVNTPVLFDSDLGDLDDGIKKLCPNYSNWTQAQKADFIVYYGAVIAMAESGCKSTITARGPNGTLIGQWQLHLGKEGKYAGGVCKKINSRVGAQNAVCGLKMLNYYTDNTRMIKNLQKELFYKGNYWETMHYPRPGAKKALRLLHLFPGCRG